MGRSFLRFHGRFNLLAARNERGAAEAVKTRGIRLEEWRRVKKSDRAGEGGGPGVWGRSKFKVLDDNERRVRLD